MEKKNVLQSQKKKELPSLRLMQSTYNMTIPSDVEEKIREACRQVWDVEWSGVLFYRHEGSFEENNLSITCVDIFLMDIGSATYTEFTVSPEVAHYMATHSDLMDCELGLVHSHNHMSTFFSGTDTATLQEEGNDRYNFVSLIVNNAGTYTAAITRRVKHITSMHDEMSYNFFDKGKVELEAEDTIEEREEIQYFMLNIAVAGKLTGVSEFEQRIMDIKKLKEEAKSRLQSARFPGYRTGSPFNGNPKKGGRNYKKVNDAFFPGPISEMIERNNRPLYDSVDSKGNLILDFEEDPYSVYDDVDVDSINNMHGISSGIGLPFNEVWYKEDVVHRMVRQLLTCSLIIKNETKFNVRAWVATMDRNLGSYFKEDKQLFKDWASLFCDFLMENAEDDDELKKAGYDLEERNAILAYGVTQELENLPGNFYIDTYMEILDDYVQPYL